MKTFLALAGFFFLLPSSLQAFDIGGAIGSAVKIAKGTQSMGLEEEVAMGRQFSAMVLGAYPAAAGSAVNAYVTKVGLTVAEASSRPDLSYHFQVIRATGGGGEAIVNAFSTPGGYIFVTEGLLRELTSEAALAGILAHEIAHAAEKHVLKEIQRQNVKAGLVELGENAARSAGVSNDFALVIGPALANNLFEKGLSKGDEYRADAAAVQYTARAGYNPRGLLDFLELLQSKEGKKGYATLFRTHPRPADRISRIEKLLKTKKLDSEGKQILANRWKSQMGS